MSNSNNQTPSNDSTTNDAVTAQDCGCNDSKSTSSAIAPTKAKAASVKSLRRPKPDGSNKAPGGKDPSLPKYGPQSKQDAVEPDAARKRIESRTLPGNIYVPPANNSIAAGNASNTVSGPASIAELARALRNDPDLIYEWVVKNCEFLPNFGLTKGGLGASIDGFGNSFDQADLLVQLFRQAGFSANYLFGELEMTASELADWLGTDAANVWSSANLLSNGGIPNTVIFGPPDKVRFSHVWATVQLSGTWYVFDPSIKAYTAISGTNLTTATGFNATTFMNNARSGATVTADYIQNLNRTNVRNDMQTMAMNLHNWIKTNNHGATTDNILGGRTINDITLGQRITVHPKQRPGSTPTTWTSVPNNYKTLIHLVYDAPNIDITLFSADIHSKRLTLGFNGSMQCELRLDGTLLATSSAQGVGTWNSVLFDIQHPYGSTWADSYVWQRVWAGKEHVIAHGWGNAGPAMANLHHTKLVEGSAAGVNDASEAGWGEAFTVTFHTWNYQKSKAADLLGRLTGCTTVLHHQVGIVGYYDTPYTDMGAVSWSASALDNNYDRTKWNDGPLAMFGVTLEASVLEQIPEVGGVSATPIVDIAVAAGQKIYDAKTSNWLSTVKPALVNYPAGDLNDLEAWWINNGYRLGIPENGSITKNSWTGYGYWANPGQGSYGLITGGLKGSSGDEDQDINCFGPPNCPSTVDKTKKKLPPFQLRAEERVNFPPPKNGPKPTTGNNGNPTGPSQNPGGPSHSGTPGGGSAGDSGGAISNFSGTEHFYSTDLSVGSQAFPYGLEFGRSYSSAQRSNNSPLGYGWKHNWQTDLKVTSDMSAAMAEMSPLHASSVLTGLFVMVELFKDLAQPFDKYLTSSTIGQWLNEKIVKNAVQIELGGSLTSFTKLPDGTFFPQFGDTSTLILNGDGTFTYKTPYGISYNFNLAEDLATIVYPSGVTITLTYTSGKLTNVTNGLGRNLNFVYTGSDLTSVNDGNGRSVSFTLNASRNLTQFTNANSKSTTYEYDAPGRLTKVFLPANPLTAVYTNIYDSQSRVKEQINALGQSLFFYLAGSRSEVVDALGNKVTYFFNRMGLNIKTVNQVGKTWTSTYDGLGRTTKTVAPEANSIEYTFNNKSQVTAITVKPKTGSPLANLVTNMTYDATWNYLKTVQDPRGNTTTMNYDAVKGLLLNIQRPVVGGSTPQVTFTYNTRGQPITRTDETSIVTQFNYDVSTEKLTSIVHDQGVGRLNITTSFGYNAWGDVTAVTDPRGNATTFVFDNLRRMTQRTESAPFSYVTNFAYTDNSKMSSMQRQTGDVLNPWQTVSYTYSLTDRLKTITDPSSAVTTLTYDGLDRLWKSTNALTQVTEISYDAMSRISTIKDPSLSITQTRTYSNNGQLASVMDSRSNTVSFSYDGHDRLDRTTFPGGTYEQNSSYDNNGNVLTFRTRDAKNITMVYDVLNRRTSKTPGTDPAVTYTYDLAGRLLTASKPVIASDPSSGTFTNFFDTAGRFFKEQYPDGKNFTHQLDANGNVTRTTWPDAWFVDRVYDQLNRMTDIKLNGAGTSAIQFQWDQLSRRKKIIYENGCVADLGFEADNDMNSLAHTFVGSNVTFSYTFDAIHQMLTQAISDGTNFQWHPSAGGTVTYGTASNLNLYPTVGGIAHTYNNNGCLTGDGTWTFGYNVESMLTTATKTGTSLAFKYDPNMRQVEKAVGATKTRFYYGGLQRLGDYSSAGALQNRYVYGIGMDEVLIQVTSAGVKTYYHGDHQGSIIAITNNTGAVTNRYKYSPFGESPSMTGTTHGYTGQRFDSESGLYYYKNRYYSPKLGRFLQPDPIGLLGGLNLYTYVENSPLNYTDPRGLKPAPGGGTGGQPVGGGGGFPFPTRPEDWPDSTKPGPNGEPPIEGTEPDPLIDGLAVDVAFLLAGIAAAAGKAILASAAGAIARNAARGKIDLLHRIDVRDLLPLITRPQNLRKIDGSYLQYSVPGVVRYTDNLGRLVERTGMFEVGVENGVITHYFFNPRGGTKTFL